MPNNAAVERWRIKAARRWLVPVTFLHIPIGIGTYAGLAGHPDDAPHLHLSDQVRGVMWLALALGSFAALYVISKYDPEKGVRFSAACLVFMPAVRAVSYTMAWLLFIIGEEGAGIGPWWEEGAPNAWYQALVYWIIVLAVMSQAVELDYLRERIRGWLGK